jgi:hypothetical protein
MKKSSFLSGTTYWKQAMNPIASGKALKKPRRGYKPERKPNAVEKHLKICCMRRIRSKFLMGNGWQNSIFQSRHEPERRWYVINDSGSDGLGFID